VPGLRSDARGGTEGSSRLIRLLLDENLPESILPLVDRHFPGSIHVRECLGAGAKDVSVWQFASEHSFVLVTRDRDFHRLAEQERSRGPWVWVRLVNPTSDEVAEAIAAHRSRITYLAKVRAARCIEVP